MSTPENNTQELVPQVPQGSSAVMPGFNSQGGWELANRIGKAFAASSLVPAQYQNNVANCIVALEMANRMGASPLMVMQNLYIVHGNPGWSSKFLIACFNQSGRFSAIRYEWNEARTSCRAWATERATGEKLVGPEASTQMAKDEGWATKNGSKWKTMPELMLMYRAAAFFVRTYAPEISMGLQTTEELSDVVDVVQQPGGGYAVEGDSAQQLQPLSKSAAAAAAAASATTETSAGTGSDKPADAGDAPATTAQAATETGAGQKQTAAAKANPATGELPDPVSAAQVKYLENKIKALELPQTAIDAIFLRFAIKGLTELNVEQFDTLKSELLAMGA